jgi:hypothetical protein
MKNITENLLNAFSCFGEFFFQEMIRQNTPRACQIVELSRVHPLSGGNYFLVLKIFNNKNIAGICIKKNSTALFL